MIPFLALLATAAGIYAVWLQYQYGKLVRDHKSLQFDVESLRSGREWRDTYILECKEEIKRLNGQTIQDHIKLYLSRIPKGLLAAEASTADVIGGDLEKVWKAIFAKAGLPEQVMPPYLVDLARLLLLQMFDEAAKAVAASQAPPVVVEGEKTHD